MILYKPDFSPIDNLRSVFNLKHTSVYAGLSELSFRISIMEFKEIALGFEKNSSIETLFLRYFIKFKETFFVISKIDRVIENNTYLEVRCFSYAFLLKDKFIKNFETGISNSPALNLSDTASFILEDTNFSLGYVSPSLDLKFRAVKISSRNKLEALSDLCEVFECVWQDKNGRIDFIDYTLSSKPCLLLNDKNFIKNIKLEMETNSLITRLHIYTRDGVSINAVNPTGQSFIDDFSFFRNSKYMSQGLLGALDSFDNYIQDNYDVFNSLLEEKNSLYEALLQLEREIEGLYTDTNNGILNLEKVIDIALISGDAENIFNNMSLVQVRELLSQQNSELLVKQGLLSEIERNIDLVEGRIRELDFNISSFLNSQQIRELNNFIIEDEYIDGNITEESSYALLRELFNEGQKKLRLNNQPRFSANLDIPAIKNAEYDIDFSCGDVVLIEVGALGVERFPARIVEIVEDFQENTFEVKISNDKDIKSGFTLVNDLIKKSQSNNNLILTNSYYWDVGGQANNIITEFLNNSIDTAVQNIKSSDNNFTLNHRGLVLVDSNNPNFQAVLNSNGLMLSVDGGATFNTAISKGNIIADVLAGKIIISNLSKFNKIEMYDPITNALDVEIGNYQSSITGEMKRGIKINGAALEITGNSDIVRFGVNYNKLLFDSVDGISVIRSDNKVKVSLNSNDGFSISSNDTNIVYIDTNGHAFFAGVINALDFQINGVSILSESSKIEGEFIESLNVNKLTAGIINLSEGIVIGNEDESVILTKDGLLISGGVICIEDKKGNGIILDEFGIDTRFIKSFKNMIFNSSFEVYDSSTLRPAYWSGGISSDEAAFFGTRSLRLFPQESSSSTCVINPEWYDNISKNTRVSFYKKGGAVKVEIFNQDGNIVTLGEGRSFIDFPYNVNWSPERCTFSFSHYGIDKIFVKFTNIDSGNDVYIDAVMVEPDFTGKWPSFYTDGPHSVAVANGIDISDFGNTSSGEISFIHSNVENIVVGNNTEVFNLGLNIKNSGSLTGYVYFESFSVNRCDVVISIFIDGSLLTELKHTFSGFVVFSAPVIFYDISGGEHTVRVCMSSSENISLEPQKFRICLSGAQILTASTRGNNAIFPVCSENKLGDMISPSNNGQVNFDFRGV